jgi:hypothetical protein
LGGLFLDGGVIVEAGIIHLFKILAAEVPLGVSLEHASVDQALFFPAEGVRHHFSLHLLPLHFLLSFLAHLPQQLSLSVVVEHFEGAVF